MHLQTRNKVISLAFLGDGWQDCALTFRALRFADLAAFDASDTTGRTVLALLKDTFVSGQGLDVDGSVQPLVADDLDQFDIEALTEISRQVSGAVDPKASPTSTDTSTAESLPQSVTSA